MEKINIQDMQIPYAHKQEILIAYEAIQNKIGEKLLFFAITGSCGMQSAHENWSDIDILIVVREYSNDILKEINKITKKSKIKMGVTLYSKYEFENLFVDAKTKYSLLLLKEGMIKYIYAQDILMPEISFDIVIEADKIKLMEHIHKLKRLISQDELDVLSIVKNLTVILKIELIKNHIISKSYEHLFKEYAKIKNIPNFDIEGIIAKRGSAEDLVNYAEFILQNVYKI